jgi:ankyrin repeat protein
MSRLIILASNVYSLFKIKKYEKEDKNIAIVFLNTRNPLNNNDSLVLKYLREEEKKELWDNYILLLIKNASKRGWDLNAKSDDGFNILSLALLMGYNQVVKFLVNLGVDVNEKITIKSYYEIFEKIEDRNNLGLVFEENCDIYPIEIAMVYYNAYNIKLLLENGARPVENNIYDVLAGARQENGSSTIELIGSIGDADLIKYLLDNGYKQYIDDLLQRATNNIKYEACKILINHRNTDLPLVTYLGNLIYEKDINLIKLFVENGAILDEKECKKINKEFINRKSYLSICIEGEDKEEDKITYYEIAKYLIENGVDVNYKNPLINTLKHKLEIIDNSYNSIDYKMFYLLVKNGANIHYIDETTGETILMAVCKASCFIDKLKLEKINRYNNYYIKDLILNGALVQEEKDIKVDMVKYLIEKGIDINVRDNEGNTALMIIKNARYEHINFLYDKDGYIDFDINDSNVEKYIFKEYKDIQIAKLLVESGAFLNIRNNLGYTPLIKYSSHGNNRLVKYLLEQGVDTNIKIEITASSIALNEDIKTMIEDTKNNNPQKLVKLLSNFTIDKPIKYTTHDWDFGELKKEYGNFEGYMNAVKKQFDSMKNELEELSPNLYKKIYTFLIEENPDENYSWCHKTHINIGWSSLIGLKEYCDSGNKPDNFILPNSIFYEGRDLTTFKDVINLFKQEIEIRENFKNLEILFTTQKNKLGTGRNSIFNLDLSTAKLNRQFYTDVEKFSNVLDRIFGEIKIRTDFPNIEVITTEFEDRSIEIKIVHIDSFSNKSASDLLKDIEDGDFAEIKLNLQNLCDWSIESSFENENFRINYLHSNNVKEIVSLDEKPKGFIHIFRFYK